MISERKESSLTLNDLYESFKEWFKDAVPSKSVPVKADVEEYFIRLWGTLDGRPKKWMGYSIRDMQSVNNDIVIVDDNKNPLI